MNSDRGLPQQSAACGVKGEDDPAFARGEHDRGLELLADLVRHRLKAPYRGAGLGVEGVEDAAADRECRRYEDLAVADLRWNIEADFARGEVGGVPELTACAGVQGEHPRGRDAVDIAIGDCHAVWPIVRRIEHV